MIKQAQARHPAKYSEELMPTLKRLLRGCNLVLDPFSGTGKLKTIIPNAILLEIEPEWAVLGGNNTIVGDAQQLPFKNNIFDAICTSPTYGNRMADHFIDHKPEKKYIRNTYRHSIGRALNENNSGRMQWGNKYKELHIRAWGECIRVLKSTSGIFILNISDHIRAGKRIKTSEWHKNVLVNLGLNLISETHITTKRNRFGINSKLRVDYETIYLFKNRLR